MSSEKQEGIDPFGHVADGDHFHFFDSFETSLDLSGFNPFGNAKFALLITIAAAVVALLYIPVARKVRTGENPQGKLWNALEFLLFFIRDQIAKPALGDHDYKKFLPFLWTMFFFILIVNLLGMIPFLASATASLAVTGALALVSFIVTHYNGMVMNHGPVGYLKTFFIPVEGLPKPIAFFISLGLFFLEIMGAVIRGVVLAVRLFANMLAGHTVLFIMLSFIAMLGRAAAQGDDTANFLFWPVTIVDVLLLTALSVLELFVACLQAFVFTFLTATFIGMARHPAH